MYFEDLEVWKLARTLTKEIYIKSGHGQFDRDRDLKSQIRRAAVSVMSNISEGYERGGNQEMIQFLSIAKGSSGEVRSQLYVARDLGYIEAEECDRLMDAYKKLSIMLNNFMESLKNSPYKGAKYKVRRPKT
jgi:four helix bundle protein